ncbi:nitrogen fixation protein NifX [Rhodobacter aestuarii]|uniref:Nitrogen fixation protein NifX n=1 Tax=Rhodobacter aestuarii TaxID=453582 RepID=A0A1N7NSB4_9RHOB|nr:MULTISPECIES: nitrogen fixation protein NifX [Rhodobacter]PTV94579.1 nitrogen fixation protein NifX [Rhodobacter aestuarii]SIT01224.1 nitrogen fixation protein NifX [Rhodobacter aestuarii]SOC12533.1 nitrogen fixation protein NifX [Rhodobacter sp. JA431]
MSRTLRLVEESDAPAPGEKPLRVAIASNDLENLDAHFGSARKIAVYEVWKTGARFVAAHEFSTATEQSGKHDDIDDRIAPKVEALEGCALVFALAIGGPSAARVVKMGCHPIKRKEPEPIADVIAQVQEMLSGSPPPFLRKILGTYQKPDFTADFDEEESV